MTRPLRVGIAGLGTVGASVIQILARRNNILTSRHGRPVEVTAISARDRLKDRGFDLSTYRWFDDPLELAVSDEVDCLVELVGGSEGMARQIVEASLRAGKHVVTANKALLAKHGVALARLAEDKGVALAFEASVAGGIPIIKTLREALPGNAISRLYGILNGTCNYILSRMELEGLTFQECLTDAQRLGYAEADPTFDVEGFDTAHKLAILTSLAFETETTPTRSTWRASRRSHPSTSPWHRNLASASSCWALPSAPKWGSSNGCTRRWCRKPPPSPR